MNNYTVYFSTPAETFVKVQAEDVDEAIDAAWDEVHVTLCHQCAREVDMAGVWEPSAVIDDATGKAVWEEK